MNIVFFGLSVSSAWGNGHATLLRGLFRSLHDLGHQVHFYERDVPYYAQHRDLTSLPFAQLHLYNDWDSAAEHARRTLATADVGIVTSYCPDGRAACELVFEAGLKRSIFYDMDAPVTLEQLRKGARVPYLPEAGLGDFDLVLSYTGGKALNQIRRVLHAKCVSTLCGWVDPALYHRVESRPSFEADLSYLGTFAHDRHEALTELLLVPARALPKSSFIIAGAMYPDVAAWPPNVRHFEHVAPPDHPAFYSSSLLTLNVTRASMASTGYCPSGRLFEAAACGTAILSDWWEGIDTFFEPGSEILIARSAEDSLVALRKDPDHLNKIGTRARQRTLDCHTAGKRARRLVELIEDPRDEIAEGQPSLACAGHN
jgi:spore maturation protein CgeB